MARIKISPDQVRQVAGQFNNASNDSSQIIQRLQAAVNQLQPDWEGITKQRFYNEYQQWQSSMTKFVDLLENISQQLNQIADRFATADQA